MMDIIEIIFELGINLIETLIIIDFVSRYLGFKWRGKIKVLGYIGVWMISFAELCIVNYMVPFEGIAVFIPVIINFVYALIFLKGSILLKLWISALIEMLMMVTAMGTNLGVCALTGYDPNDMITVFNTTRVISVIITKILLFYSSRLVLRYRYKKPINNGMWIMIIVIPMISVLSLSALMLAALDNQDIAAYIFWGMFFIVVANIVTYYFFTVMSKNYDAKLKIEMLEQQNENALESMKNSESFVSEMRSVKHDIKNHLLTLYNYIDENQNDSAKEYIKGLTENYLPNIQKFVDTENKAFDALVNSKMAICHQKNIHIDIKPEKNCMTKIDESDIIVLFGNLLDNAIEATEKTVDKHIKIEFGIRAAYLSIIVLNTVTESVLKTNPNLETTKNDKYIHGLGLRAVNNIVEKYDGLIDFFEEDNYFGCHVMLVVE